LPIKLPKFYEECLKSFAKCSAANRGSVQGLNGNDLAKMILFARSFCSWYCNQDVLLRKSHTSDFPIYF